MSVLNKVGRPPAIPDSVAQLGSIEIDSNTQVTERMQNSEEDKAS